MSNGTTLTRRRFLQAAGSTAAGRNADLVFIDG